jgi:hypothetical protein
LKSVLPFLILAVLISVPAFAKRAPPPTVPDIKRKGVVYSHGCEPAEGGYACFLKARKVSAQKEIWKTRLYSRDYNKSLEIDVQDVAIASLKLRGSVLVAVDEDGRDYKVDAKTGKLLSPPKPIRLETDHW